MTKGKKPAGSKGRAKILKLEKETLKDLDANDRGSADEVKGGMAPYSTVATNIGCCVRPK